MIILPLVLVLFFHSPKNPVVQDGASGSGQQAANSKQKKELPPSNPRNINAPSTPQRSPEQGNHEGNPSDRVYKVDVVTPATQPQDTPLFPVYLWLTGAGVFVNAAIFIAIFWQNRINWRTVKINVRAARAARTSARA